MLATRSNPEARGFTLLELLTVIGIIVILVGLLLPCLSYARKKAAMAATKAVMKNIVALWESIITNGGFTLSQINRAMALRPTPLLIQALPVIMALVIFRLRAPSMGARMVLPILQRTIQV